MRVISFIKSFHSVYLPLNPSFPGKDLPADEHWHSLSNYTTLEIVLIHSCFALVIGKVLQLKTCVVHLVDRRWPSYVGLYMTMALCRYQFHPTSCSSSSSSSPPPPPPPPPNTPTNPGHDLKRAKTFLWG